MTPAELRAVSRLGGQAFAGLVSRIEQVHHPDVWAAMRGLLARAWLPR